MPYFAVVEIEGPFDTFEEANSRAIEVGGTEVLECSCEFMHSVDYTESGSAEPVQGDPTQQPVGEALIEGLTAARDGLEIGEATP